jgi:hypothetical protein
LANISSASPVFGGTITVAASEPLRGLSSLRHTVTAREWKADPVLALLRVGDFLKCLPRSHRHQIVLGKNGIHLQRS